MTSPWRPPSPRVAELMRAAAARLLENPTTGLDAVDRASLTAAPPEVRADPALAASMRATTYANLVHWLGQVLVDPGVPVPPAHSREGIALARDLVRRGLDAGALNTFRAGQNAAWQLWMGACFALSRDPDELQELLQYSARSIFGYVDASLASIAELVEAERDALLQSVSARRLEAVALVLDGAPISVDVASERLGHDLRRPQVAAVLFREPGSGEDGLLERAAEAVGRALGAPGPLSVVASALSRWAWYAGDVQPEPARLVPALRGLPGVRVALGGRAAGLAGFRRSHLDALATQRLMLRAPSQPTVTAYDEVQVAALLADDEERALAFLERVLGGLAGAETALRDTLRLWLLEGRSATRAARRLFTHRNTVLNRLARAQELLPVRLEEQPLAVGVALELAHWLGPPRATGSDARRPR